MLFFNYRQRFFTVTYNCQIWSLLIAINVIQLTQRVLGTVLWKRVAHGDNSKQKSSLTSKRSAVIEQVKSGKSEGRNIRVLWPCRELNIIYYTTRDPWLRLPRYLDHHALKDYFNFKKIGEGRYAKQKLTVKNICFSKLLPTEK